MTLIARVFCVLALVAFAAGAVANAAGAAAVASDTVAQDAGMTGAAGCDACDDMQASFDNLACQFVCGAGSLVALQAPSAFVHAAAAVAAHDGSCVGTMRGIAGPGFTQPPRSFL